MNYRRLGKTGLMVSEIGLGGEWLERHNTEECIEVVKACESCGINILDCWMSEPNVRSNLGRAIAGNREHWYVQGHIGSTWQNGQYVRTRELPLVKAAFEDLLARLQTDYIDLGMIHYIDDPKEWDDLQDSPFMDYVRELKAKNIIHHIGMSTHNPLVAQKAVKSGVVEMMLFSINPSFDYMPPTENLDDYFNGVFQVDEGHITPERVELYSLCEQYDVGLTVMKPFFGGRLLDAQRSPFGVALTTHQCIHYCLNRPMVGSVLCGVETIEQVKDVAAYETASDEAKDYATVLSKAPLHTYSGQCTYCGHCKPCPMDIDIAMVNKFYDLATIQPEVPASVRAHYQAMQHKADECIGCQTCETRCPFGVKISERMQKASELFG